jgi:hypothetical protein
LDLIALLVQEQQETLVNMVKKVNSILYPQSGGNVDAIEQSIQKISSRVNYGSIDPNDHNSLRVWRWEVDNQFLVDDVRDMINEQRKTRVQFQNEFNEYLSTLDSIQKNELASAKRKRDTEEIPTDKVNIPMGKTKKNQMPKTPKSEGKSKKLPKTPRSDQKTLNSFFFPVAKKRIKVDDDTFNPYFHSFTIKPNVTVSANNPLYHPVEFDFIQLSNGKSVLTIEQGAYC